MSGRDGERTHARDVAERSEAESRAARLPPPGTPGKIYTAGEKAAALRAFSASGQGMRAWCNLRGISTATLCAWRRAYTKGGAAALEPKSRRPRGKAKAPARAYTPEERRAALDAFKKSGMTQQAFCRLWGISVTSLRRWLAAHAAHGPKGLEAPWGGARRGRKKAPVPDAVRAEIVETKRLYPTWGLRRIRDALARFAGLRVGVAKVREVVKEEGLETPKPKKKVRRAPPRVRRFERSKPRELWQSDITSYVLTRHSQRVYLTVFLDDHSRYVVAWSLALQQRSELVCECLLEGLARFGKPKEVLTDQGRQYFAWRGKSRFQKLLIREGIQHVVSRAHHPQTLGKCERLWKTVGDELWYRARPQDLDEARRRLGHFFDHYNHFRPHQGIGGLVPADRFFGAEEQARAALEARMDENALRLAVGDAPRRPVFLYGQIDGEPLSVHGERGRLVIQGLGGERNEIEMSALGGGGDDARDEREQGPGTERDERPQGSSATPADGHDAASDPAHAGAVGGGDEIRSGARPRDGSVDAGVLAGQDEQGGAGGEDRRHAASRVAAESAGDRGDGVRSSASAAVPAGDECDGNRSGERPQEAEEEGGRARAGTRSGAAADRHPEDASRQRESRTRDARGAGEEEGVGGVATSVAPRPQEGDPGEGRREEESDSPEWWESAWGELFEEWEDDEGTR